MNEKELKKLRKKMEIKNKKIKMKKIIHKNFKIIPPIYLKYREKLTLSNIPYPIFYQYCDKIDEKEVKLNYNPPIKKCKKDNGINLINNNLTRNFMNNKYQNQSTIGNIPKSNCQIKSKFSNNQCLFQKLDESLFILNDSDIKSFKIYSIRKLLPHQKTKIKEILDNFHKNGIPRNSDDFNYKKYSNFYPLEDPFFYLDEVGLIHNHIKIYNEEENDINKIQIYQGDLNIFGKRQGLGKLITQYYELKGIWKNDKFSGWGRQSRCNGDIFEGKFDNGLLNGKGFFLDKQSNKYIGEFKDMKRWGKGKLITNKIIYEGDFVNNKIEGKGKIKFLKSGIEYEGTFVNDNIEGTGILKWINGDIYEGEVKNGIMHGQGIYKNINGKIIRGIFENGQIVQYGDLNNNFNNVRTNNEFITNKFDYAKPFRKIDNLIINHENNNNNNILNNTNSFGHKPKSKPYLEHKKDFNENKFNINEYKVNKYLNAHENNKYALNSMNIMDKLNKDNNKMKINVSTNIFLNNSNNNIIKPKEIDNNPELLLSNYRNFGFGEFNN